MRGIIAQKCSSKRRKRLVNYINLNFHWLHNFFSSWNVWLFKDKSEEMYEITLLPSSLLSWTFFGSQNEEEYVDQLSQLILPLVQNFPSWNFWIFDQTSSSFYHAPFGCFFFFLWPCIIHSSASLSPSIEQNICPKKVTI